MKLKHPLLLASTSPRRRSLLQRLEIPFDATGPALSEAAFTAEQTAACPPRELVQILALAKGQSVRQAYPEHLILAADTVVVCERQLLGKPQDAQDALNMLQLLAGRSHQVLTGVVLLPPAGDNEPQLSTNLIWPSAADGLSPGIREAAVVSEPARPAAADFARLRQIIQSGHPAVTSFIVDTKVTFNPFDEELAMQYIHSGAPLDKAGAYGIQDRGGLFVESIEGDYYNVVGLPIAPVFRALRKWRIPA